MRVRTNLRALRGEASIGDVARRTNLAKGEVSMIERGHLLPRIDQAERMVPVYGPRDGWYPRGVLAVLGPDIAYCPGCERELPPEANRQRVYHDERCRAKARRHS